MTQENKELLFKDLCGRLPYHPRINVCNDSWEGCQIGEFDTNLYSHHIDAFVCDRIEVMPYLRPMSNMTEREKRELQSFYPGSFGGQWLDTEKGTIDISECSSTITLYLNDSERVVDWLNAHHFDYRGLIEKGLALEAPEEMYNN